MCDEAKNSKKMKSSTLYAIAKELLFFFYFLVRWKFKSTTHEQNHIFNIQIGRQHNLVTQPQNWQNFT